MGFQAVYNKRNKSEVECKIAILPPDVLNSNAPPMGRQQMTDKVLHLAAEGTAMRRNTFQTAVENICSSFNKFSLQRPSNFIEFHTDPPHRLLQFLEFLPHQLGLTRESLQRIAIST